MSDLKYTQRDFQAIFDGMKADAPYKTPEMTNFNPGELGVLFMELLAGSLDILSYNLDGMANEAFLSTALAKESVQAILRAHGYEMRRRTAATAVLTFTLSDVAPVGGITIPAGTICSAGSLQFATRADAVIPEGATTVNVTAYQGTYRVEGPFTPDGASEQIYTMSYSDVADNFFDVYVGNDLWTEEKFVYPLPTLLTTIYRVTENFENVCTVEFSKYLGSVPAADNTKQITFKYVSTDAESGNVGAGTINKIVSTIGGLGILTLSVTNALQASGGRERESIEEARVNGPRALRTLERAVTVQDFIDLLLNHTSGAVESVTAQDHNAFTEIWVRLQKSGGDYQLLRLEPPYIPPAGLTEDVGGTLTNSTTVYVGICGLTADDAAAPQSGLGPPINPATGTAFSTNPRSIVLSGGADDKRIVVSAPTQPGYPAAAYHIYAGTAANNMKRMNTDPVLLSEFPFNIDSLAQGNQSPAPTTNETGTVNPITARKYYDDLTDYLEVRRTLCTAFQLYNVVPVTQNVAAAVTCLPTYKRSDVQTRVTSALGAFFSTYDLGQPLYIAAMEAYIFNNVAGVANINITTPAADVTVTIGQYVKLGTVTLTMSGGIV